MFDYIQPLDPKKSHSQQSDNVPEGFSTLFDENLQQLSLEEKTDAFYKELLEMKNPSFMKNMQESALFSEAECLRITSVVARLDVIISSSEMTPALCQLIEEWLALFKELIKGGSLQNSEAGMQANFIQSQKQKIISNMSWDGLLSNKEESEASEGFQLFEDFSQKEEKSSSSFSLNFDYLELYLKNQSLVNHPVPQASSPLNLESTDTVKSQFLETLGQMEAII